MLRDVWRGACVVDQVMGLEAELQGSQGEVLAFGLLVARGGGHERIGRGNVVSLKAYNLTMGSPAQVIRHERIGTRDSDEGSGSGNEP